MKILALDLGTKTGWAGSVDKRVESGVQDFSLKRGESPGMRFVRFNSWLVEMIEVIEPDIVIYEQPHNRGGAATMVLNGMLAYVLEKCAKYEVEHEPVHSSTLKKFATGSGRAGKEDMIKVAQARFPEKKIIDDNEADALCIWLWGQEEFKD